MKSSTAIFMLGMLLMSTGVRAQVSPGTQQLGIALGAANPLTNDTVDGERARFGETGFALGFDYLYQFSRHMSFGADLNIKSLGDKDIRTGHGAATVKSSAWTLLAIARGDMIPDNNIRPYGMLGLGMGGVKRKTRYDVNTSYDHERTSGGLAFAFGAGVDLDINADWLAGAELRYDIIGTSESEIGADNVKMLDLLFKVGYKF